MKTEYSDEFYLAHREGSRRSAQVIVPLVLTLVPAKSVVDAGCGSGSWLSVFQAYGVRDFLGLDAAPLGQELLEIPAERFMQVDFNRPVQIPRQFDLVLSLEVAEHLEPDKAERFIDYLSQLGPAILFSAAIPFQGGTLHLNEQWPDYWAALFEERGYLVLDPIRKRVWDHTQVEYWYAQNTLLFAREELVRENPALTRELQATRRSQLALVHPALFAEKASKGWEAEQAVQAYVAEVKKLKAKARAHQKKAEFYIAEAEQHKKEIQVHKEKAEFFYAEAEGYKLETQEHKTKAEFYIAEAERYRMETQEHKAKAEFYIAEVERYRNEAAVSHGRRSANLKWGNRGTNMSYLICDLDLAEELPAIALGKQDTGVAVLVRQHGAPVGFFMQETAGPRTIAGKEVRAWISQRGLDSQQLGNGAPGDEASGDRRNGENGQGHSRQAGDSSEFPFLTVAICTKDNPLELARCLERLEALRAAPQAIRYEILVVDNAPADERTERLVASHPAVRYVREPRPGLNFARNRAVRSAQGAWIAFIDDDVQVDRYWLNGLEKAWREHPDAGAITGLVLPAELCTESQILFEKRGGFEKNFRTVRFGAAMPHYAFYPCVGGKFGTGCNMSFRRQVLEDLGGFDEALDTGAALPGGGDTDMFYRVIRAGLPIIFEPQFLVFHRHRRELRQLKRQFSRSWGQGLMAFVYKTYRYDIAQRKNLRDLVAWWFADHFQDLVRSLRGKHILPARMLLAEIWGGLTGLLFAYPRSQKRTARIRREFNDA